MRVLLLGGYGLLGSHIAAQLSESGHQIVGLSRSRKAQTRFTNIEWHQGDLARMTAPADWEALVSGVEAVVNCAGALQDSTREALHAVHVAAPAALYETCSLRGIRRVVHISSVGIDGWNSAFARTKREGEDALKKHDLDWVILRPGLVLAPNAFGGTALIRGLAGFPVMTPLPNSTARMQIVAIEDVAKTVALAVTPEAPSRVTWDLVHPDKTRFAPVIAAYRDWLGFGRARICPVPRALARLVSGVADGVSYLGWRSPMRTTALNQLFSGVEGDPTQWMKETGIRPLSLAETLARHPAGLQDRWFARAYFLKPLGIGLLAAFWLTLTVAAAPISVPAALWSAALGMMVLIQRTARLALMAMAATALVCAVACARAGMFLPIAFISLTLLALMDER